MLCFLVLVASSCPPRYLKVLIVNDLSRVQELGSEGARLHSQRTFSQMQSLFSQAFACEVNLTLVGQLNFASGQPSAVTPRFCNTTWPTFQNSHPIDSAPCCTLQDRSRCFEGTSYCVGNSYRYDKNMAGCFDVTSSRLFQGRSVTLIELGAFLTNASSVIDGFQYASDFRKYVFDDQISLLQGMFDTFHIALLFSSTSFAGNPISSSAGTLCNSWAGGAISAPKLAPIYLAGMAANAIGLAFGLGQDTGCTLDNTMCSALSKPCSCPSCGYVMGSPAPYFSASKWSSCSVSQMNSWFDNDIATTAGGCLRIAPRNVSTSVCGNGIVEPGEQCDQSSFGAGSSCCDSNCKLQPGCQCASGACCGSDNRLLRGVVCRAAQGVCDVAETCTGDAECPPDGFLTSGTVCGPQQTGRCYTGQCVDPLSLCPSVPSLDAQSQSLCATGTCTTFECFSGYGFNAGGAQTASCTPFSRTNAGAVDGSQCGFVSGSQCLAGKCVLSSQITLLAGTSTATQSPTKAPTLAGSQAPTRAPTTFPPTPRPSVFPTPSLTNAPSGGISPTFQPSQAFPSPTPYPTFPTPFPTFPTPFPTFPTPLPTSARVPTSFPTLFPTPLPSRFLTPLPTPFPTPRMVPVPTLRPSTPVPTPSDNPKLGRNGDLWILCPDDVVVPISNLANAALVDYPTPTMGEDGGGSPEVRVVGPGPLSVVPFGNTTVTLIVVSSRDPSRQTNCSFQIRVVDQTPPVIFCPSFVDAVLPLGASQVRVYYAAPNCTDSRGCQLSKVTGPLSGELLFRGWSNVVYRATDSSGNIADCTFMIRVRDANSSYFVTCPRDLEFSLPQSELRMAVDYPTPLGSNGTIPVLILGVYSGQVLQSGNYTIMWQLGTDVCSFLVRVYSSGVLICPKGVTQDIGSINATSVRVQYVVNTTDGSTPQLVSGFLSDSQFPFGTTPVVYSASGSRCYFNVLVQDQTPPVITCPRNVIASLVRSSPCIVIQYDSPVVSETRAGFTVTSLGLSSGACFPAGTTRIGFAVTSTSGQSATCNMLVIVQQNATTILSCPFDVRKQSSSNQATVTYPLPTASAGTPQLLNGLDSGSVFPLGATNITFGLSNLTCTFTVLVVDNTPPSISCPAAISQAVANGEFGAKVFYPLPEAYDGGGPVNLSIVEGFASGSFVPIGFTRVTFQARDGFNNTANCSFRVTVFNDPSNPGTTAVCPGNLTVPLRNDSSQVPVYYPTPVGYNSHIATLLEGRPSGANFPFGITKVTFAVPIFLQFTNCTFFVHVVDQTPPIITCPSAYTRTSVAGAGMALLYVQPTATDNRGDVSVELTQGLASGGTFAPGATLVVYQATDASHNTATCSFWVFILNLGQPDFVACPPDVTATLTDPNATRVAVKFPLPAASDGQSLEHR